MDGDSGIDNGILFNKFYDIAGKNVKEIEDFHRLKNPSRVSGITKTAEQATAADKSNKADRRTGSGTDPEAGPDDTGFKLEFTSNNIMNGIILSELLGKPKILQKRRW